MPEYASLPPSQIVPTLLDKGKYIASESSFYRVLKAVGQLTRRGQISTVEKSSVMMSMTENVERWHMREQCFNQALVLHSDNGAPIKSLTFKAKMEELGITSSYSRSRVSDDIRMSNRCSVRLNMYRVGHQRASKV